jgi:hypothetical protein
VCVHASRFAAAGETTWAAMNWSPGPPRPPPPLLCLLAQNGVTGLYMASQNGHLEVARLLLDRGAAVDAATTVRDGERG